MNDIGKKKLTDRQRELLAQVEVVNNVANFTGEQIPDWKALKVVMVAIGGKWKSRVGFEFADGVDAVEVLRIAKLTGVILDPAEADFYETPAELADEVCAWAELKAGMTVLEPSAGRGVLALRAKDEYKCDVFCVEPLASNRAILSRYDLLIPGDDFLLMRIDPTYDRVIMNPPFSKRNDILHVTHAMQFLVPGGVLVAIMSASVSYRDDRLGKAFRKLMDANDGVLRPNPDGSFKGVGTMVRTVMVKMRKIV